MKKLFLLLAFSLSCTAQVTAVFPTRVATDQDLLVATNNAQSTLAQPLSPTSGSLQLVSAASFRAPAVVTVDHEIIWICSLVAQTQYVCPSGRGFDGTFTAFHAAGTIVNGFVTAYALNRHSAELKALQAALGPNLANVAVATHRHDISQIDGVSTTAVSEGTNLYVGLST